jgi:phenylpropionate dioxygenase-like ring-hydroxylating dioxygenase large terminal subunit
VKPVDAHLEELWSDDVRVVPKAAFASEELYQLELERIFLGPIWHALAHIAEIPNPGDFKSTYLGETPILLVHQKDGQIKAFYNACTHRGTLLETRACGHADFFECPYHGWMFHSDGTLAKAPGREAFPQSFKETDFALKPLKVENFKGLIFVTASHNPPTLAEFLGEIATPLSWAMEDGVPLEYIGAQKVMYQSNWKAYRDNDGYHPPLLHAAFRILNWQGGKGRIVAEKSGNIALISELSLPKDTGVLKDGSLLQFKGSKPERGSLVIGFMPALVITHHLDMINVRYAIPRGAKHVEVHYCYYVRKDDDEAMRRHRLRQSSNLLGPSGLITLEDAAVFHRIQKATETKGEAIFLKGCIEGVDPYSSAQNDEVANLVWWQAYRRLLGLPEGRLP